ncbi:MAG TPA: hypothetical protein VHG71_07225 [Verrucomicrobiae bacterium]|nr:hypothetical protein [Verrucomicrobiae bacterium]
MNISDIKAQLSAQGLLTPVDVSEIYVHDGKLLRVIEDAKTKTVTMEVLLPASEHSNELVPRRLVFTDVYGYQIFEGRCVGCPTILDLSVVEQLGNLGKWSRVRLDTTHGYRELCCTAVRICDHESVA